MKIVTGHSSKSSKFNSINFQSQAGEESKILPQLALTLIMKFQAINGCCRRINNPAHVTCYMHKLRIRPVGQGVAVRKPSVMSVP